MNKIGSLYQAKGFYWLLFPNKDTADNHAAAARSDGIAAYWSKRYNCNVSCVAPESLIVLLETDGRCKKFLTTNGEIGWIRVDIFSNYFEEVTRP